MTQGLFLLSCGDDDSLVVVTWKEKEKKKKPSRAETIPVTQMYQK